MNRLKHPEPVRVRAVLWILSGVTLLYGAACVYLYYHQQVSYVEGGALFESDLPFHVSMAVKDHWYYSLTALFYQLFYLTPWGSLLTAVFLGVVSVASVVLTGMLLDRITAKQCPASVIFIMALAGSFMMPIFIRGAHFQRYIGYQSASIWHNSTYICMKLLSIGTITFRQTKNCVAGRFWEGIFFNCRLFPFLTATKKQGFTRITTRKSPHC